VTSGLPVFELAHLIVRLDHGTGFIEQADDRGLRTREELRVTDRRQLRAVLQTTVGSAHLDSTTRGVFWADAISPTVQRRAARVG
jgi:hypothetical protein